MGGTVHPFNGDDKKVGHAKLLAAAPGRMLLEVMRLKKRLFTAAAFFALVLAGALVAHKTLIDNESSVEEIENVGAPARFLEGDALLADALLAKEGVLSAVEASSADCFAALAVPEGSSQLMVEQRRLHIQSVLEEAGGPLERALAADIAGYRPEAASVLDNGLPASLFWTYSAPNPLGERKLSVAERRRLEGVLQSGGIEELAGLDDAALLSVRWGDTTLTGHLIAEHGETLYGALPTLDGRLPVGMHELAIAIEEGVALADFETLLDDANVNLTATWRNGTNLAKIAAIRLQPDILRFLMSNGVDPAASTTWGRRAALDDIASLSKPRNTAALADVVELLVAAGDQPYLPRTLATLRQWLPAAQLPALHADAADALLAPAVTEAAKTVAAMDAEWTRKIDAAMRLEQRCERLAGSETHAGAFRGTGLAAKRRHQAALMEREQRWLRTLPRPLEGAAGHEGDAPTRTEDEQALADAVSDGRWDDAIGIADAIGSHKPLVLLFVALGAEAPLDVLLALTQRNGGVLPKDAAWYLAGNQRSDASAIAEALEPYGLDPHDVDAQGRNAFNALAEADLDKEGTWRFAEYLASRSVSVKPTAFGLDPLDITLTKLLKLPQWRIANIRFARFLIDHGAPVERSHRQLAAMLATADANTYQRLVSVVPELAS